MAVRVNAARPYRSGKGSVLGRLAIAGAIVLAAFIWRMPPEVKPPVNITPVVGEFDTVSLPVPISLVPAGTKGREIKFKRVAFPSHQVPPGALTAVESILEASSVAPLPANLPLFKENFSLTAGLNNPVIERIPPGMRAMTVRVDATSAVEGWAGSGSVIDVLLVEKDRTTVVAERVKVLSAERSVSPVEGAAAPSVPTTVTLLVTQDQCLGINTAIPRGKIAFALRSARDEASWTSTIFTAEKLKGATIKRTDADIHGVITVTEDAKKRSFALAGNKWIQAETIPDGFFVAGKRE